MRHGVQMTDVVGLMGGTEHQLAEVLTRAMEDAGDILKGDWREAIEAAGLGAKLGRTIRSRGYPERGKSSLDPAAYVWTKAPKIIDAYSRGVTIRARNGKWLAWQTGAAGAKRVTPRQWEQLRGLKLRFVPLRGGKSALLVADNARVSSKGQARQNIGHSRKTGAPYTRLTGRATVVIFTLHRSAQVKKRFDLDQLANAVADQVSGLVSKHWSLMNDAAGKPLMMDDRGRPLAPAAKWSGKRVSW